jgi:integrase
LTSLSALIAIDVFKDGLRHLLERRGGRSTATVVHLATSLKAIARHHVRVDPQHLERMAAVIARLEPPKRGLTAKNRSRLRALDNPQTALALVQLPAKLITLADREQRHPLRAARLAQTAVALEILLMAPIRIANLSRLDIERHLIRPSPASNTLHIVIDSDETKNREPLEYPLPAGTITLIERYLAQFRPVLAPAGGTALFPGGCQGRKHGNTLREQIAEAVFTHTGMRVHPHLFRHIAAKLFLDANPGSYEVMRRVLGHRSIDTTTAFYTGLETAAAVRHFDATILKLRNGGVRA